MPNRPYAEVSRARPSRRPPPRLLPCRRSAGSCHVPILKLLHRIAPSFSAGASFLAFQIEAASPHPAPYFRPAHASSLASLPNRGRSPTFSPSNSYRRKPARATPVAGVLRRRRVRRAWDSGRHTRPVGGQRAWTCGWPAMPWWNWSEVEE
jgi:hypothetical protein